MDHFEHCKQHRKLTGFSSWSYAVVHFYHYNAELTGACVLLADTLLRMSVDDDPPPGHLLWA